jgi:hypothetical protein
MFHMFYFNVTLTLHVIMNARWCSCAWFEMLNACLTPDVLHGAQQEFGTGRWLSCDWRVWSPFATVAQQRDRTCRGCVRSTLTFADASMWKTPWGSNAPVLVFISSTLILDSHILITYTSSFIIPGCHPRRWKVKVFNGLSIISCD